MNTNIRILIILLIMFSSCQKREWNNPFDPECPKESWTPTDLAAKQQGNAINLTWVQDEKNISGFRIERKIEGETAWKEVVSPEKATNSWTDQSITGGKLYEYRIVALAGGNESNFATVQIKPLLAATLTTAVPLAITATSALLGGTITADGGAAVTERGICWATTTAPTTGNNKLVMDSGTGTFISTVTGLTTNTTYYARAYAINSQGTAYGNEVNFKTSVVLSLASLTTNVATNITSTSAILGGAITSDGNATVTERGVCYSTSQNPTTSNSKLAIGSGIGSFSSTITDLVINVTYYARAYATNSQGTTYGEEIFFTTSQVLSLASVTTSIASSVTSSSAVLGGSVTNDGNATVTERGICYSTIPNPTTLNAKLAIGNGSGTFSSSVSGLTANTTYYVRAYAINSQGTAYGNELNFRTSMALSLASLTTSTPANITSTSATLGGNITSDGNATVTERGICYSTSQNPTTSSTKLVIGSGSGTFSNSIAGLTANTTYYVRAYAINSQGTAYGNEVNLKTSISLSLATLTTSTPTNITSTSASLGGNITSDGNAIVTERGICYSTIQNPTTSSTKLAIGNGTGTFSNSVSGLTANTTYYVRAYAINSQGTAYGNEVNFKTSVALSLASLTTTTPTSITTNSATLGGDITSDGNATVTERGICYSTNQNPTTSSTKLVIGSGIGSFSNSIAGLTANTTYYVRAYAINSQGTAYGNEQNFKTGAELNTVTDIDGNIYHTVTIGTQVWMAENLKTTRYNDGTNIPNVTDADAWSILTTGAYCWYDNDVTNKTTYGALYNWYTVNTGKLAPKGWHVSTDAEWTTLTTYLGGINVAGSKLKETGTAHWNSPNSGATNISGFTALPGGYRYHYGTYSTIGYYGIWWSSTEYDPNYTWGWGMGDSGDYMYRNYGYFKSCGFSVRCVRD